MFGHGFAGDGEGASVQYPLQTPCFGVEAVLATGTAALFVISVLRISSGLGVRLNDSGRGSFVFAHTAAASTGSCLLSGGRGFMCHFKSPAERG